MSGLEFALDLLDGKPERRVVADSPMNQVERVNHGRMVAAKMFPNCRKGTVGHFPAQVHRDLSAKRDVLCPFFRLKVREADMEEVGNDLLDHLDIRLQLMRPNQVA